MRTLRYPYKPGVMRQLLAILLFGGGGYFLVQEAQGNTKGLIINETLELSPYYATVLFWCLAAIFGLGLVISIFGLVASFTSSKELIVTESTLTAPGSMWPGASKVVRISDIAKLETQSVETQRFLNVYHPGGKLSIAASCLPSGAFDELCAELADRTQRP